MAGAAMPSHPTGLFNRLARSLRQTCLSGPINAVIFGGFITGRVASLALDGGLPGYGQCDPRIVLH
jgi:hypothetical protein